MKSTASLIIYDIKDVSLYHIKICSLLIGISQMAFLRMEKGAI